MKGESLVDKYTLYTPPYKRLLWHLMFWGLMFIFSVLNIKFLFKTDITALPSLIYALLIVAFISLNHYIIVCFGIHLVKKRQWYLFIATLLVLYFFSVLVVLPLDFLSKAFPQYDSIASHSEKYYIHSFLDFFSFNNFIWVCTVIFFGNLIAFSIKVLKNNYESNVRNTRLEKENTELELSFLRAQIHPHFLFNTLNNIYGLVIENEKASQIILKLSDLLRFSLYESNGGPITLGREIEFLTDYISLEQIRHNNSRVSIQYCLNEVKNKEVKIAPLLLINFIENAFKHGIKATRHGGWVKVHLMQEGDIINFTVKNSKPANKIANTNATGGLGMGNVKRRLSLLYPEKHHLFIQETKEVYEVTLTIHTNE